MQITLYKFTKRTNSLKLVNVSGLAVNTVELKQPTSIYSPTFVLRQVDNDYTYLKWGDRYYFIIDFRYINATHVELKCTLDVLATYRSDILAGTAYVQYSSSEYDTYIPDTRLTTVSYPTTSFNNGVLLSDASYGGSDTGGTYIIGYITDNPTYGASGLIWGSQAVCNTLASELTSTGFKDFLGSITKEFNSVYDAVISLKHVPFEWYFTQFTDPTGYINLGGYTSGASGVKVKNAVTYSLTLDIPWQYNDFRNLQPYTSVVVFLPAYGYIELNPADLANKSTLNIKLVIDGVTGEGTYIIENFFRGSCNFANDVSIGTMGGNMSNLIGSAVSLAGGAVIGGGLGALTAIPSAISGLISSQQRNLGTVGGLGGGASVKASFNADWRQVYIYLISHDTNQTPASMASQQGRPLNKVTALSGLTGYVQTVNASINAGTDIDNKQINSLMDGGVYFE